MSTPAKITTPVKITPAEWGPAFWKTLHLAALGFPRKPTTAQRDAATQFYTSLKTMLPCVQCAKHFSQLIEDYPPVTASRDDLVEWTVNCHNRVNGRLEKPTVDLEAFYGDVLGSWAAPPPPPSDMPLKVFAGVSAAAFLVMLVLFLVVKTPKKNGGR